MKIDPGTVVDTKVGPIEYAREGTGPAVLILHGTPGGHDQGPIFQELIEGDYTFVVPSKAGLPSDTAGDRAHPNGAGRRLRRSAGRA